MRHLDLFSGIGGFARATEMVWENVEHAFVEIDPFCQAILRKHWPQSQIYGDIRSFKPDRGYHLLTGGYPCQPFSSAGKKRGKGDARWLWPEMLRVIQECRPTWVIAENVVGTVKVVHDEIITDLEGVGYATRSFIIPACAVGAPHRRDRVWVVAHTYNDGFHGTEDAKSGQKGNGGDEKRKKQVRQPKRSRPLRFETTDWQRNWLDVAAEAHRMDDGLPHRIHRIKALGGSIVPQVAAEIMRAIRGVDNLLH